ncbi:hypothetical protein CEP53_010979 [Fusarium sp. AF-6]|nr:hypothetical protein CEP53_010979 [Fusarium sp. AF-6]
MSSLRVPSLDTEGGLSKASHARSSPQPSLAENSANVETLSGNPPPTQGVFMTPENDSFYKSYSYSDLNSTAQDIRLIHVFKNEQCDLIQCEFLPQSSLRQVSGSYHALSYCAGDPSNAESVLLQGIKFNVFANLNHALEKTLAVWESKYPEEKCILWVDQICINQRSNAERSHQVGLMRDIYTNSRETFICLSTADQSDTSSNGLDWFKEFGKAYQPSHRSSPRYELQDFLWKSASNSNFLKGWASFYELVQCPWWRRAWVHQEFICSPSAIFMYRDSTISSTHTLFLMFLCQMLHMHQITKRLVRLEMSWLEKTGMTNGDANPLREMHQRNMRASSSLEAVKLLLNAKESWRGDEDIKKVLARSRHCRSSDPRDRIFAFLGLTYPGYGIEADYSKSNTLDATNLHTAKKILEFDRHLEILIFAVRATRRSVSTLPSWVPDWASAESLEDGLFPPFGGGDMQFQKDAIGSSVIHTSTGDNSAVLRVQGLQIDTLEKVLPKRAQHLPGWDFETARGYTVKCRHLARHGDELWMLMGSRWPFILRPWDGEYKVVSDVGNRVYQKKIIGFEEILGRMRDGRETLSIIDLC